MEELYTISIQKKGDGYLGLVDSKIDGTKEIESDSIEQLLRNIYLDIQAEREELIHEDETHGMDIAEQEELLKYEGRR